MSGDGSLVYISALGETSKKANTLSTVQIFCKRTLSDYVYDSEILLTEVTGDAQFSGQPFSLITNVDGSALMLGMDGDNEVGATYLLRSCALPGDWSITKLNTGFPASGFPPRVSRPGFSDWSRRGNEYGRDKCCHWHPYHG